MTIYSDIELQLKDSVLDSKIDVEERTELRVLFSSLNSEMRAYTRNKAFDIANRMAQETGGAVPLKWLEQIIKLLDNSFVQNAETNVTFSPGDECRRLLIDFIRSAKKSLNICVFTISDNRISEALVNAYNKGIHVRIISDNDKKHDKGSDIAELHRKGINTRLDDTRHHMHHKFATKDSSEIVTGSFNWTASASRYNHENIIHITDTKITHEFDTEFERLWAEFSKNE